MLNLTFKNFCLAIFVVLITAFPCLAAEDTKSAGSLPSDVPGYSIDTLRLMSDNVIRTGMGRNAIMPLYRPAFVRVSDAGLAMDDREPVFVVEYPNGMVRIYPQYIMVWHEIVNDVLPAADSSAPAAGTGYGQGAEDSSNSFTITYSPITGCVTAFRSMAGRYATVFGNEGTLYNGNIILYDTTTGSLWSQILAVAIDGQMRGKRLERYPVYWCRWGGVKSRYPNAQVLSRATGYKRNYGRDPYGSYLRPGSYYDDARLVHQVQPQNNRLPLKERILGLEIEGIYGAMVVDSVRQAKVLNQPLGLHRIVGIYDEELDRVRVFDRRLPDGTLLDFQVFEGKYTDRDTRSQWNSDGECVYGRHRGKKLTPILAVDSMWYAWYSFHPDTKVLGSDQKTEPAFMRPDIPY